MSFSPEGFISSKIYNKAQSSIKIKFLAITRYFNHFIILNSISMFLLLCVLALSSIIWEAYENVTFEDI